ncbi:quino protein amine dehydrogenase beta chain-like protein [Nemania diffusa]|nr:quino protein amine dehydrogenase beta chain-like protein [Nemania diffusa]
MAPVSFFPTMYQRWSLADLLCNNSNNALDLIYQFPNLTALENIAVRSSGKLLVTLPTAPEIYQVDPFHPVKASLVHHFLNFTALLGIDEIEPDIFAVVVGTVDPLSPAPGSFSVWKVDLRTFETDDDGKVVKNATAKEIVAIPEGALLNGLISLPGTPFVLVADSGLGVVWRINLQTAEYIRALSSPLMTPPEGTVLGVNGIKIYAGELYFTNTLQEFFGKVPIHLRGNQAGTAAGEYSVVVRNGRADDFTFDKKGNAYIAQNYDNGIQLITPDGNITVIAGSTNSTVLESDAACIFSRTQRDRDTLYVVTDGGLSQTVPGTYREGGKIVAVHVDKLGISTGN